MYVCDANKPNRVEEMHKATNQIMVTFEGARTPSRHHACADHAHVIMVLNDVLSLRKKGVTHIKLEPIPE